jgi:hypothetical protein
MSSQFASTNVTFDYLKDSADFLNIVLNNICSCVLLLNKEMELQAFNDAMKTIFSNKEDEHLLYIRCGEAIGCAYTVEEAKDCGKTSQCKYCELRESALFSYIDKKPVYKQKISREFYKSNSQKVMKHLEFSTRPFLFDNEYYVIMIIEDITENVNLSKLLEYQNDKISELTLNKRN